MAASYANFLYSEHTKVLEEMFENDKNGEIAVSRAYELYKEKANVNRLQAVDINRFGILIKSIFPEPIVQKKRKVFEKGCLRACYYTGIACRKPRLSNTNPTELCRKPLKDRTNTACNLNNLSAFGSGHIDLRCRIEYACFEVLWNSYSKNCKDLGSWKLASLGSPHRLVQYSSTTIDGFPIVKVVDIFPDLTFSVKVANITCSLVNLGWRIPPLLTDFNSLVTLLNIVAGSKVCLGSSSDAYEGFDKELKGGDMKVCGVGRFVDIRTDDSDGKISFFSVDCIGFLPYLSTDKACSRCHALQSLLRKRVSRMRSNDEKANTARSTNWRYLNEDVRRERIADLQRRKINSDKRAQYATRYLKEERNAKLMTQRDHNDLKIMLEDIDDKTKREEDSLFAENADMKFFWDMQKDLIKQGKRSWHPKVIDVCLRLWNRSKTGYTELRNSGFFKLPSGRTLQMRKNSVRQSPGLQQTVLEDMRQTASKSNIPETGYHGFVVFDEMSIQGNLEMKKVGDSFEITGLVNMGEFNHAVENIQSGSQDMEMATHILQFVYHSCQGSFQYPFCYFPTSKLTGPVLAEVYWDGVGALLHSGFNAHMGICDGGQANRTFILLHFESEEEADANNYTTSNPYNGEDHVFMMDPSHNFKKLRNNIEKSCSSGKTTRMLTFKNKQMLWRHWKESYGHDCKWGVRTFPRLSDDHFILTPTSRMRNHLADDVLSPKMKEIMMNYKNSLDERGSDSSCLDLSLEFLENVSILLKNFKSKAPYKSLDDSRFLENESVVRWLDEWQAEVQEDQTLTASEKCRRFISTKTRFDLRSMVRGFKTFCEIMMNIFSGVHLISLRTSQDYVELFFACQRAQQGQNNNPTEWQYATNINAITKLRNIQISKANCGQSTTFD